MANIVKRQYSEKLDKTKLTFSDGREQLLKGRVSSEPISDIPLPSGPSILESVALGGVQGASFGLGDEAYGAGAGLYDVTLGDKPMSLDSLMEAYGANRDVARARIKAGEEENPVAYNIANIAAGFAVPAGALGSAAKGASFAQKALSAGKMGAAAGALSGFGSSEEKDLTGIAKDTAGSAVLGGALGAGVGAVVPAGVSKLDDIMSQFKAFEITKRGGEAAREGTVLFGNVPKKELKEKVRRIAKDVIDETDKARSGVGKSMGDLLEEQNQNVLIEPTMREITETAPYGLVNKPEDVRKLNDVVKTIDTAIQKVERKEIVGFTPVGKKAVLGEPEKTMNLVLEKVAAGNKTAYDTLARYIIHKELGLPFRQFERTLEGIGIDSSILRTTEGSLAPEAFQLIQQLKNPDDIVEVATILRNAKFLPDPRIVSERDMQTGLDVIRSVRGDSTISVAIPKHLEDLVTKIKPIYETKTIVGRPSVTSEELENIIRDLKSYTGDSNISASIRAYAGDAAKKLEGLRDKNTTEALGALRGEYATTIASRSKLQMAKNYGTDIVDQGKRTAKEEEIAETIEKLFGEDSQRSISFEQSLAELRKVSPEIADRLEKEAKDTSFDLATAKALTAEAGLGGNADIFSKLTQIASRTIPTIGAYVAGKGVRAVETTLPETIKKATSAITKIASNSAIYKAAPEQLQQMVEHLASKNSAYANKLAAVMKQPDRKRNALLFTLMQQPGFREEIGDIFGE